MRLTIFLRSNQPANHGMLQKELTTTSSNYTSYIKCKIVIKDAYSKFR